MGGWVEVKKPISQKPVYFYLQTHIFQKPVNIYLLQKLIFQKPVYFCFQKKNISKNLFSKNPLISIFFKNPLIFIFFKK